MGVETKRKYSKRSSYTKSYRDCAKCGHSVDTRTFTRHERACFTNLTEFAELMDRRGQIDLVTGCVTIMRERGGTSGEYPQHKALGSHKMPRISNVLMEFMLGRKLAGHPSEIVMHACDNRRCVNWWHLRVGTQADNVQDMIDKGRASWQKS